MGNISDIYHIAQNKLQKALDFVENDSNALTVRGALYIHKKEFKHAIADLEKCVNKEIDAERQKNKNLALGWTNSDDVKQESTADTSNTSQCKIMAIS